MVALAGALTPLRFFKCSVRFSSFFFPELIITQTSGSSCSFLDILLFLSPVCIISCGTSCATAHVVMLKDWVVCDACPGVSRLCSVNNTAICWLSQWCSVNKAFVWKPTLIVQVWMVWSVPLCRPCVRLVICPGCNCLWLWDWLQLA